MRRSGVGNAYGGVVSLAGEVPPAECHLDWNVAYDVIAADAIAKSGVKWTCVCGDVMGVRNGLQRVEFDALEASRLESAAVLLDLIVHMKRYRKGQDPTARTIRRLAVGLHNIFNAIAR